MDKHTIRFPEAGLRDLGTLAERLPPGSETRTTFLEAGMMIAVNMPEQPHPLSVAKVLFIFEDKEHGAVWARVNWFEPLKNKFRGVYRANPAGESYAGNLLLTPLTGLHALRLVHWGRSTDDHPVLTMDGHLRDCTMKIARLDVRLDTPELKLLLK